MSEMHQCELQFNGTPPCMGTTNTRVPYQGINQWACEACIAVLTGGFCRVHGHAFVDKHEIRGCPQCMQENSEPAPQMMG